MKRMLIAGALALVAAEQALAADLPQPAPPPPRAPATYVPAPAPVYNWGGIYIGINGGGSWVNQAAVVDTVATTLPSLGAPLAGTVIPGSVSTSSTGFAGGGQIGANFQASQLVFGIEADADYLSNKTTVTGAEIIGTNSNKHEYTLPFFSTVRGRLGFAADRVLLYGTGGLAMGEYKVQRTQLTGTTGSANGVPPAAASTVENYSDLRLGWTAGAGLEVALAENWTARVEYLYASLESVNYTFAVANRTAAAPVETVNLVRAGVNVKFGGY